MRGTGAETGWPSPFQNPENTVRLRPECVQAGMGGQALPPLRGNGRFWVEALTYLLSMEATLRPGLVTSWLILLISLGWSAPSAAQTESGWTVQLAANAGYFKSTRDIGKILGEEVQATIITDLQAARMWVQV